MEKYKRRIRTNEEYRHVTNGIERYQKQNMSCYSSACKKQSQNDPNKKLSYLMYSNINSLHEWAVSVEDF